MTGEIISSLGYSTYVTRGGCWYREGPFRVLVPAQTDLSRGIRIDVEDVPKTHLSRTELIRRIVASSRFAGIEVKIWDGRQYLDIYSS